MRTQGEKSNSALKDVCVSVSGGGAEDGSDRKRESCQPSASDGLLCPSLKGFHCD